MSIDYPESWPDLLPQLVGAFQSRDLPANQFFAALITAKSVVGAYEFMMGEDRQALSTTILPALFPSIQSFASQLISTNSTDSSVHGYIRAAIECFEMSIQMTYEQYYCGDVLDGWMLVVLGALTIPMDESLRKKRQASEDIVELDSHLEWKLKRTAFRLAGKYYQFTRDC